MTQQTDNHAFNNNNNDDNNDYEEEQTNHKVLPIGMFHLPAGATTTDLTSKEATVEQELEISKDDSGFIVDNYDGFKTNTSEIEGVNDQAQASGIVAEAPPEEEQTFDNVRKITENERNEDVKHGSVHNMVGGSNVSGS